MLKRKYHTTPLYLSDEKPPLQIEEPERPSSLRGFQVLQGLVRAYWRAQFGPGRGNPVEKGIIWRHFFEETGGLWIKVGELTAMRTDLYDFKFILELSQLQPRISGFPFSYAREKIENSIGCPLEQVFLELDERPLTAGLVAQVHRGRLRYNGKPVLVKVRRPFAKDLFEADRKFIKKSFQFLSRFMRNKLVLSDDLIWELDSLAEEEVDFRFEIRNIKEARKEFESYDIYIPKVYKQYSSEEVIVMEYVHGVAMAEFIKAREEDPERLKKWVRQNKVKPKKLGRYLIRAVWEQVLEQNFFHAALHPDNVLLLRKNRLAFVGLGNVGVMDKEALGFFKQFAVAIGEQNFKKAADLNMLLAPFVISEHRQDIQKRSVQAIRTGLMNASLTEAPPEERSILQIFGGEVPKEFARYGIPPNWNLLKINQIFLNVDPCVLHLYPRIDFHEEWLKWRKDIRVKEIWDVLNQRKKLLANTQSTNGAAYRAVTRNAIELKDKASKNIQVVLYFLSLLRWVLWAGLFLFFWAYLYQHHEVIDHLHDNYDSWILRQVERLPFLPGVYWFVIKAVILLMIWRYYKFRRDLSKPRNRY